MARALIFSCCFIIRLPLVLEGSSPSDERVTQAVTKMNATLKIDGAKLNENANYFNEIPLTANNTVLKSYKNISPVQCVLRCKRHKECVNVAFKDDKVCLLLSQAVDGTTVDGSLKQMGPVKFPGLQLVRFRIPLYTLSYSNRENAFLAKFGAKIDF